jgi:hypothetical protein
VVFLSARLGTCPSADVIEINSEIEVFQPTAGREPKHQMSQQDDTHEPDPHSSLRQPHPVNENQPHHITVLRAPGDDILYSGLQNPHHGVGLVIDQDRLDEDSSTPDKSRLLRPLRLGQAPALSYVLISPVR